MGYFRGFGLASGGAGILHLMRKETENLVRDRLKQFMQEQQTQQIDKVEFEIVKTMAENALLQNLELKKRVSELEALLGKKDKNNAKKPEKAKK